MVAARRTYSGRPLGRSITSALGVGAVLIGMLVAAQPAAAAPAQKVWVCKYVNVPGHSEVLKVGNNGLIHVSANSLVGFRNGVELHPGVEFVDKHSRSVVVQVGSGPYTGGSSCGSPDQPE